MNPPSARSANAVRPIDPVHHVLAWGVAIPVIYFGIQVTAALFHPGYSFFSRDASSLGSSGSTAPWIFNVGALVIAVIEVALAGAFLSVLPRAGVGRGLTMLTALALVSAGIGSLNAFLHPLPDPRHTEGLLATLGSGFALLPVVTTVVMWRMGARRQAVVTIIVFLALIPVMTGLIQRICVWAGINFDGYQSFLNSYHGLIQRLGAAVMFVPVAIVAYLLRRRTTRAPRAQRAQ